MKKTLTYLLLALSFSVYGQEMEYFAHLDSLNEQILQNNKTTDIYKRAVLYYEYNQYRKAAMDMEYALQKDTNNISYKEFLAQIYQSMSNLTNSLNIWLELYHLQPDNLKYISKVAKEYYNNHQLDSAEVYFNKWHELDSSNTFPLVSNALIYIKKGETLDAFHLYQKVYKMDSTNIEALKMLSRIYSKANEPELLDSALFFISKALDIDSSSVNLMNIKAKIYFNRHHFFRAMPLFKKVLAVTDSTPELCFYMGMAYVAMRKYEDAMPFLNYSEREIPDNYNVYNFLGVAYSHLNDSLKAVQYFEKSLQILQPSKLVVNELEHSLAAAYEKAGMHQKAINLYYHFIKSRKEYGSYTDIGDIYMKMKNKKKALHFYSRFLEKEHREWNEQKYDYIEKLCNKIKEDLHFEGDLYEKTK